MNIKNFYNQFPYPNVQDTYPKGMHNYSCIDAPKSFTGDIFVIGCGTGEAILIALKNPNSNIYALDLSLESIKISQNLCVVNDIKNLTLEVQDITSYVPREKFDIAVCSNVLHHIPDVQSAVNNIYDSLKNTGYLQGSVYSKQRPKFIREISDMNFDSVSKLREYLEKHPNEWFNTHLKNDEELADTYLNPYWIEYDTAMLSEIFSNFSLVNFVSVNDKIHFQCKK